MFCAMEIVLHLIIVYGRVQGLIVLHLIIVYGRVQGLFGILTDCMLFGSARSVYRGASILHRIFSNKGGSWFISAFENSRVEVEWVESTWAKLLYDIAGTIAQLVL